MKALTLDTDTLRPSLEDIDETAALEAFSVGGLANRIADLIPNLVYAAKKAFDKKTTDKIDLDRLDVQYGPLEKALSKANFLDIGSLWVQVPQGFSGKLSDYVAVLHEAVTYTNDITARMMAFNQLLSGLLSDPNVRMTTRDLTTGSEATTAERNRIQAALAQFISPTSRLSKATLEKTFYSCKNVLETTRATGELIQAATQLDLKTIEKMVEDASELLGALAEMAQGNNLSSMTPEALRNLSSATLTCARDVELHALLMYAVWQVKISTEENARELTRALRY